MHRTYVRRRIVTALLALVVVAIAAPAAARAVGDPAPAGGDPGVTVVVQPGDTLWDIAARTAPAEDPRQVVDAIVEANGLVGGTIVPGQSLVVPAV